MSVPRTRFTVRPRCPTCLTAVSVRDWPDVAYSITNYVDHPDALASQQVTLTQYCIIGAFRVATTMEWRRRGIVALAPAACAVY